MSYRTVCWNGKKITYENKPVSKKNLIKYLWDDLVIKGDVRVRDLFEAVIQNEAAWQIVLQESCLTSLLKEYKRVRKMPTNSKWINTVEFGWYGEEWNCDAHSFTLMGKTSKVKAYHDVYIAMDVSGRKRGAKCNRGISMCELVDILDAKIRIKPLLSLTRHRVEADADGNEKKEKTKEEIRKEWTAENLGAVRTRVIDIFKWFFWEITFYGTPERQREVKADLERRVDEAKSGKATLYDVFTGEEVTPEMRAEKKKKVQEEKGK